VHYVDLLLAAMGPVAEVTAITATQTHQIEAEDTALALLRFRSGALGTIVSSTSVFPGFAQRLEVTGTNGTVVITDGEITSRALNAESVPEAGRDAEAVGASTPAIGVASHAAQLADLLAAIDEDREPVVTAADGRAALEVIQAVYESAKTGHAVQLPLTET
jgi:predicted dehydrogenase